jgi:AbrB family looped-hinge helix DNA binding protein
MESYISKVTTAGQITLPKEIRTLLGLDKDSYVEFDKVGNAIILRKLKAEEEMLKEIRRKIKKSGITKEQLTKIIKETSRKAWKENYAKNNA